MDHKRFVSGIILFAILVSVAVNAKCQSSSNSDSLITGRKYKITLFDDREVIGTVTRQDSAMVYVKAEDGFYQIKKEDIFKYSRNLMPSIFKAMFWAGGGLSIMSNQDDAPYNGYKRNNKGFALQLSAMYPFSETKGIRLDLSYARWKDEPYTSYDFYSNYTYSERSTNFYYVRANFMFGSFSTMDKFKIYGLAGLGANFRTESEYSYTYYYTYDSSYHTYTNPEQNYSNLLLSIGGGLGYMFSKNAGVYGEAEYNTGSYFGYFFYFGGGYFLLKAGVLVTIF